MAIPKVFVSSTCFDLKEERAQLERFIENYGFQPILSEYSGVYFDVDQHTHESCVNEVAHCDLFVLIISGRYGGKYKEGNGESITQAEYNKARELGLPVFSFVKADVYDAQHIYKENIKANNEEFAKKIQYPAIDKQKDAAGIFNFIESVHRASENNAVETYQSFTDIESHLKKQWAGMFHSFLQKRKEKDKVESMGTLLNNLMSSSNKLETLVESLHSKELGPEATKEIVDSQERESIAIHFYQELFEMIVDAYYRVLIPEEADKYIIVNFSYFIGKPFLPRLEDYLDQNSNWDVHSFGETCQIIDNRNKEVLNLGQFQWHSLSLKYLHLTFNVEEINSKGIIERKLDTVLPGWRSQVA